MKKVTIFIFLSFQLLSINMAVFAENKSPIDHIQYEIRAELDHQNRMLNGRETIRWYNHTGDTIPDICFHLYWNAFKNEKSAMMQESRESSYSGIRFKKKVKDGEWGWVDITDIKLADGTDLKPFIKFKTEDKPTYLDDQTVICIKLPKPLAPGETLVLNLDFEARIPRTNARAGYYGNGYFFGQWFPKPGVYEEGIGWNCHQYHQNSEFFADFAEFTVHMTVPKDFVLGASGKEIARKENKKKGTVTYTHHQANIHDFAWTVDPDYIRSERDFIADKEVSAAEYSALSKRLNISVDELKLSNVKMILLLNPEHRGQEDRHFKALRMAIKYYGLWYGPYPYETMTLLDPPFNNDCGGMEYPTLITAGSNVFLSDKPGSPEHVIIHEFGHNFWYGMVASNEFEEPWIDEGINSYSDSKVMSKAYGKRGFPFRVAGIIYDRYLDFRDAFSHILYRAVGIQNSTTDPIITKSWQFYNPSSYGLNVYMRAATALHTIERVIGEDLMIRVLRTFQMEYRYKHPKTADFIEVLNRLSGKDMTAFFNQLFSKTLELDFGIASVRSNETLTPAGYFDGKDKRKIQVTRKQAAVADKKKKKKYLSVIDVRRYGGIKLGGDILLKIKIVFEDGQEDIRYWDGKNRWIRYKFIKTSKVKFAQVDPENKFLIDTNFTNNSLKLEPDTRSAKRVSNKLHFWIQNLFNLFSIIS